MNIFIGIIGLGLGFLMAWKSDWIMNNFGRIPWAEEKLGLEGGTRIFWKILGVLVIIGSFMLIFNMWGGIFGAIFGGGSSGNIR